MVTGAVAQVFADGWYVNARHGFDVVLRRAEQIAQHASADVAVVRAEQGEHRQRRRISKVKYTVASLTQIELLQKPI